jgi:hypothetical protein
LVLRRVADCILVAILVIPGETFLPTPAPPTLEAESRSPVCGGLQVAVKSLRREGDRLHLAYTFRWVGEERTLWFLREWGRVNLSSWDSAGNRMDCSSSEMFLLRGDFSLGKVDVFEGTAAVDLPARARFIALELGRSGIVTNRVAIPE